MSEATFGTTDRFAKDTRDDVHTPPRHCEEERRSNLFQKQIASQITLAMTQETDRFAKFARNDEKTSRHCEDEARGRSNLQTDRFAQLVPMHFIGRTLAMTQENTVNCERRMSEATFTVTQPERLSETNKGRSPLYTAFN